MWNRLVYTQVVIYLGKVTLCLYIVFSSMFGWNQFLFYIWMLLAIRINSGEENRSKKVIFIQINSEGTSDRNGK